MHGDAEQELEEARERYLWGRMVLLLWATLILSGALAILWILTVILDWQPYLLLGLLGLLAGIAILAAVWGSRRGRTLTGLVLGGLILPLLAAHLSGVAARSPETFSANSAALMSFVVYATVAFLTALSLSALWRGRSVRPSTEVHAAAEPAPPPEGSPS